MTTDDILDQLLYVLVQAYNHTTLFASFSAHDGGGADTAADATRDDQKREGDKSTDDSASRVSGTNNNNFPIAAVLKYISDYHFINSNTTALGFTIANFQVAIEYFLLRASHVDTCRTCQSGRIEGEAGERVLGNVSCSQGILVSKCELAYERNVRDHRDLSEMRRTQQSQTTDPSTALREVDRSASNPSSDLDEAAFTQLVIVGDWSSSSSNGEEQEEIEDEQTHDTTPLVEGFSTQTVKFDADRGSKILHISGGQRFFAVVSDQGKLFTWGDRSGGRLGYPSVAGDSRRVIHPHRVAALDQHHITHVACGAFHTLATDVNGHVFAWGSNARGQLGFLTHDVAAATTTVDTPTLVTDLKGTYMSAVSCGEYHSLGLSSDGSVFSWGCNKYSKLGRVTESFADAVVGRADVKVLLFPSSCLTSL